MFNRDMKLKFEPDYVSLFIIPYLRFIDFSWDDIDDTEWGIEIGWIYYSVFFSFGGKK